jgi:hypothetical protein
MPAKHPSRQSPSPSSKLDGVDGDQLLALSRQSPSPSSKLDGVRRAACKSRGRASGTRDRATGTRGRANGTRWRSLSGRLVHHFSATSKVGSCTRSIPLRRLPKACVRPRSDRGIRGGSVRRDESQVAEFSPTSPHPNPLPKGEGGRERPRPRPQDQSPTTQAHRASSGSIPPVAPG